MEHDKSELTSEYYQNLDDILDGILDLEELQNNGQPTSSVQKVIDKDQILSDILNIVDSYYNPELSPSSGVYTSTPSPIHDGPEVATEENCLNLDISKAQNYQQFYQHENQQYFQQNFNQQQEPTTNLSYQQFTPQIQYQQDNQGLKINVVFYNFDQLQQVTENNGMQKLVGNMGNYQKKKNQTEPVVCPVCGKIFKKHHNYTQHFKAAHTDLPHRCEKCGKKYADRELLLTHMNRHSSAEKRYKCSDCPKQFHYICDLTRHKINHTNSSRHVCNVCNKIFARKDHMVKHIKTHFKQ